MIFPYPITALIAWRVSWPTDRPMTNNTSPSPRTKHVRRGIIIARRKAPRTATDGMRGSQGSPAFRLPSIPGITLVQDLPARSPLGHRLVVALF